MHISMVFVKRYPKNKTSITHIKNEPWHYRYVGKKSLKDASEESMFRRVCRESVIDSLLFMV